MNFRSLSKHGSLTGIDGPMSFDIDKIADLARLSLKPEERMKLQDQLSSILDYVKGLDKLDTQNVEPTSHVLNMENVFREDEAKLSGVRDKALEHAPAKDGKFFKVPKTVERE